MARNAKNTKKTNAIAARKFAARGKKFLKAINLTVLNIVDSHIEEGAGISVFQIADNAKTAMKILKSFPGTKVEHTITGYEVSTPFGSVLIDGAEWAKHNENRVTIIHSDETTQCTNFAGALQSFGFKIGRNDVADWMTDGKHYAKVEKALIKIMGETSYRFYENNDAIVEAASYALGLTKKRKTHDGFDVGMNAAQIRQYDAAYSH